MSAPGLASKLDLNSPEAKALIGRLVEMTAPEG